MFFFLANLKDGKGYQSMLRVSKITGKVSDTDRLCQSTSLSSELTSKRMKIFFLQNAQEECLQTLLLEGLL